MVLIHLQKCTTFCLTYNSTTTMYCLIKLVSIIICILAFSSFLETIYKPSFVFLESCYFHKVSSSIIIDLLFSLPKRLKAYGQMWSCDLCNKMFAGGRCTTGCPRERERKKGRAVVQSLLSKHNVHMLPFLYSKVKYVFIELFVL